MQTVTLSIRHCECMCEQEHAVDYPELLTTTLILQLHTKCLMVPQKEKELRVCLSVHFSVESLSHHMASVKAKSVFSFQITSSSISPLSILCGGKISVFIHFTLPAGVSVYVCDQCVCVCGNSLFDSGRVSMPSIFSCQPVHSAAVPAFYSFLDITVGVSDHSSTNRSDSN